MPDYGFNARGRELPDKGGDHIVPQAQRGQRPDRVEERRGDIGHHARDEHDREPVLAAVFIDGIQIFALADDFLRCLAEEEAQQQEADGDADGLGHTGQDDAGHDPEDQCVGCGEDDGRREAEGVHKEGEPETEKQGPGTEGLDVFRGFHDVPVHEHAAQVGKKLRIQQMYDGEEQYNQGGCDRTYHAHGFLEFQGHTSKRQ